MYILQHPGGSDLKADDQELGGPEDFPESGGHPNIRFIHYVNSDEGSSGAPCFDKSFSLFGIHQGTWPHPPAKSEKANRGIAVTSIFRHVDTTGGIPPPDPENVPVWNLADDDGLVPAIGRQEFQRLVWSAASTDDTRILVIRGGDQSGKSYLLNMLDNMLPDALHAKVEIFSETLTLPEGTAFVDKICRLAHAAIPAMQTPEEFGQSRPTWREAIIKKLVEALEAAHRPPGSAESRMTWLLFRDMNKPETYGLEINELISLLCEAAAKSTGLRIVLDGFEGSLSQEANRMAKPYTTTLFTAAEIEKFLLRVNAEYGLGVETAINGWVEVTMDEAGANATNKALADKVTAIATAWARKKKKKGP
jgi:hypothetical protein